MAQLQKKPPIITYVLSYPGLGLLKIGQAQYYADRLTHLRTGSPVEPVPVCAFVGAHHERELHERFGHLRDRREYFRDCDEIRKHLNEHRDRITHEEALRISSFLARKKKNRDV